jgi:hypothetical protein
MISFGLLAVLLCLLLTVPLILRGDRAVGLSGLLTGFGAFWSFLMARQVASGRNDRRRRPLDRRRRRAARTWVRPDRADRGSSDTLEDSRRALIWRAWTADPPA